MDDGDILCHPIFVPTYLHEFDDVNDQIGAERRRQKSSAASKTWTQSRLNG